MLGSSVHHTCIIFIKTRSERTTEAQLKTLKKSLKFKPRHLSAICTPLSIRNGFLVKFLGKIVYNVQIDPQTTEI